VRFYTGARAKYNGRNILVLNQREYRQYRTWVEGGKVVWVRSGAFGVAGLGERRR
jgi:hypothetical protein